MHSTSADVEPQFGTNKPLARQIVDAASAAISPIGGDGEAVYGPEFLPEGVAEAASPGGRMGYRPGAIQPGHGNPPDRPAAGRACRKQARGASRRGRLGICA